MSEYAWVARHKVKTADNRESGFGITVIDTVNCGHSIGT